jgi:hypothetical protein
MATRFRNNVQHILTFIKHRTLWASIHVGVLLLVTVNLPTPHPVVTFQTTQTVYTSQPHLCTHTRLIDEVETWKVQRSLQMVREMGADHIVEFFPWAYVQHAPSGYDWVLFDRIMAHAQNQGLSVIARLGFVPEWVRADLPNSTLNTLPDDAYDDFATFAHLFAKRYAGVADEIIIWNEPNLAFEWGYQHVDPEAYARLLRYTYPAVKAGNPDATVWMAGMAPTLERSPNALEDLAYIRAIYDADGAAYFDGIAVHTYGFRETADAPPQADSLNFRRVELIRELMVEYGDDHKPIHITETGWNDDPHWVFGVPPSQRAQETIEALRIAEEWEWLDQMCVWMFRTPAPSNSHQDGYTIVTSDFQPKALYYALQSYAQGDMQAQALWLPAPSSN